MSLRCNWRWSQIKACLRLICGANWLATTRAQLFSAAEAVIDFNEASFDSLVNKSKRAWVVMYYATWCPHCQHYAPVFDSVAVVYKHDNRISWGAVDCAEASNSDHCTRVQIHSYPTLRAYHLYTHNDSDTDLGAPVDTDYHSPEKFVAWIGEQLQSHTDWETRLADAEAKASPTTTRTTASIRSEGSTPEPLPIGIGYLKALHMQLDQDKCLGVTKLGRPIAHMRDCDDISPEADDRKWRFEGMHLQSMYSAEACLLHGSSDNSDENSAFITKACLPLATQYWFTEGSEIKSFHDSGCLSQNFLTGNVHISSCSGEEHQKWIFEPVSPCFLHLVDAEVGLLYALREGVVLSAGQTGDNFGGKPTIAGETLTELKAWLKLLVALLPSRRAIGHVNDLTRRIQEHESNGTVDAHWLLTTIDKQQIGHAPPEAAKNVEKYLRSCKTFTCSLWTVFHMLTVAAAENDRKAARNFLRSIPWPTPGDVLRQIRSFVKHFFGCADCATHFLSDFDSCKFNLCGLSPSDGQGHALWLWRQHNSVTARTAWDKGLGTLDPWPPESECNACWETTRHSDDSSWSNDEVYAYLKRTYWHDGWHVGGKPFLESENSEDSESEL